MSFLKTKNNTELFPFKDHSYPRYKSNSGHDEKAINQLCTLIEKTLSYYSVQSIIRIDLHPDKYSDNNKVISTFLVKEIKKFKKMYDCRVCYFFAREQSTSDKQHYHLALFFSGHKVKSAYAIEQRIKGEWKAHCNGSTHFVEKPLYLVKRGDKDSLNPAIYRLSYLTKKHTKENNDKAKSYGSSRIRYKGTIPENDILFVNPEITYLNRKSLISTRSHRFTYISNQRKPSISSQPNHLKISAKVSKEAQRENLKIISSVAAEIANERPP